MLYVLEKKSRAGTSTPALDTFIMAGFEDESDCLNVFNIISKSDSRTRVNPLDKYLAINKYPRFHDETGKAGVIKKFNDSFMSFPLIDVTAKLIQADIMIIDVIEGNEVDGKYMYSQDDVKFVVNANDKINDTILLGKGYLGSFIYRTHSGLKTGLEDFIAKAKEMRPSARFLVIYVNPTMRTLIKTENMVYTASHESIVVTGEDSAYIYYVSIEESKLSLSVIEVPQLSYRIK